MNFIYEILENILGFMLLFFIIAMSYIAIRNLVEILDEIFDKIDTSKIFKSKKKKTRIKLSEC